MNENDGASANEVVAVPTKRIAGFGLGGDCICTCDCGSEAERFQAWLAELDENNDLEEFFGAYLADGSPDYERYGRDVRLWQDDDEVSVRIDNVTIYAARETEVSEDDFDDDLVLAGDWDAVAEALTEKHFGEWFMGDENDETQGFAERAAEAAGVAVAVAEQFLQVSESHFSATFTSEYAEELAGRYAPELAELAGMNPTQRVEAVLADCARELDWLGYATKQFEDRGRKMLRVTATPDDEAECLSVLAEKARVFDDEAELHIAFATPVEVNA